MDFWNRFWNKIQDSSEWQNVETDSSLRSEWRRVLKQILRALPSEWRRVLKQILRVLPSEWLKKRVKYRRGGLDLFVRKGQLKYRLEFVQKYSVFPVFTLCDWNTGIFYCSKIVTNFMKFVKNVVFSGRKKINGV